MSGKAVKISSELLTDVEKYAEVFSRSVPKQIEHWVKIGKIVEDNPDLSYAMIKDILFSKLEMEKNEAIEPRPYLITRDKINKEQFDIIMQKGLEEAESNKSLPVAEVFAQLRKTL